LRAYLCTPGFESALAAELGAGRTLAPGVVTIDGKAAVDDPVFARQVLPDARAVGGPSVRALAEAAYTAVEETVDAWPGPFTLHGITTADIHEDAAADLDPGLGSRAALVGRALLDLLGERRRRARRRYLPPEQAAAAFDARLLLVQLLLLARDRLLVSAAAPRALGPSGIDLAPWPAGAAPVAVDRAPPSRAYQKLEEAFQWMGRAPATGELVVDLGAAPGGWTATALKRGARVIAVDRAPLALARDARADLAMVIGNAFTYEPPEPQRPVGWLLSDVVCEPARSLGLVAGWLQRRWCQNLVVTVKFKGRAGYGALNALPPLFQRVGPRFARVKQLAHNKNEVTVMVSCYKTGSP
jgi:23S rRNA (cytidine2498-2'-O)-methyltransferase